MYLREEKIVFKLSPVTEIIIGRQLYRLLRSDQDDVYYKTKLTLQEQLF
jgi:hypothetical protein